MEVRHEARENRQLSVTATVGEDRYPGAVCGPRNGQGHIAASVDLEEFLGLVEAEAFVVVGNTV